MKKDKIEIVCKKICAYLKTQSIAASLKLSETGAWVVDVDGIELRVVQASTGRPGSYRIYGRVNGSAERYYSESATVYAPSTKDELAGGTLVLVSAVKNLLGYRKLFAEEPAVVEAVGRATTAAKDAGLDALIAAKTLIVTHDGSPWSPYLKTRECTVTVRYTADADKLDGVVSELIEAHKRITGAT